MNPPKKTEDTRRFLAFKALPPRSTLPSSSAQSTSDIPDSETGLVRAITDEIVLAANKTRRKHMMDWRMPISEGATNEESQIGDEEQSTKELDVEEKDVISVADAKKSTGYLEQLGYAAKKLVWG